jgi:hypothetical protein
MHVIFSKSGFVMGSIIQFLTYIGQRDDSMYGIIKFWEGEKQVPGKEYSYNQLAGQETIPILLMQI